MQNLLEVNALVDDAVADDVWGDEEDYEEV